LTYYRALTRLRRGNEALRSGSYRALGSHDNVFTYMRDAGGGERVVVALNMTGAACEIELPGMPSAPQLTWCVALGSHRAAGETIPVGTLTLEPFEALIARPR